MCCASSQFSVICTHSSFNHSGDMKHHNKITNKGASSHLVLQGFVLFCQILYPLDCSIPLHGKQVLFKLVTVTEATTVLCLAACNRGCRSKHTSHLYTDLGFLCL